jgi:protein kinase C substrate 80K-H
VSEDNSLRTVEVGRGRRVADTSYTYELCLFGKATQKSNRDSSSNHLGWVCLVLCLHGTGLTSRTFTEWKTDEAPGTYEYYTRQYYRNG